MVGANCGDAGGNRQLQSIVLALNEEDVAGRFTSAMVVKIGFPRGGCERDRVQQRQRQYDNKNIAWKSVTKQPQTSTNNRYQDGLAASQWISVKCHFSFLMRCFWYKIHMIFNLI